MRRRPFATFAPSVADRQARAWWGGLRQAASSLGAVAGLLQALRDADVRPLLSKVTAKTLVLHRTGDRAVRAEAGRYLAGKIAGARFVRVKGGDHWFWVGQQGVLLEGMVRRGEGALHVYLACERIHKLAISKPNQGWDSTKCQKFRAQNSIGFYQVIQKN